MLIRKHWAEHKLRSLPDPVALQRYHDDPVGFAIEQCGITPWDDQADLLTAAVRSDRVAARSGQKTGKTKGDAVLAYWWIATRPRGRVICLANTYPQLRNVLWREVRATHHTRLPGERVTLGQKLGAPIQASLDPMTGILFDERAAISEEDETVGRQIFGLSTKEPERLQGISGDQLLFIIDESAGFPDPLFHAVLGNVAGGGKIIATSQPNRTTGWFFDVFHERWPDWERLVMNSEHSPNVRAGRVVIRGLALPSWIQEMRTTCGANYRQHPLYRVRVLGEFPRQSAMAIISLAALEAAARRWLDEVQADGDPRDLDPWDALRKSESERRARGERLWLGVDVARYGDDNSVIIGRRGSFVYPPVSLSGLDGPQLAREVEAYALRCSEHWESRLPDREKPAANVDVIGVGASCYDALRQTGRVEAYPVNVSEKSDDPERWPRLRDQLWDAASEFLEGEGQLPPSFPLERELLAPEYAFDASGRKVVEPKDKTKQRLDGQSPDHGDAFVLCLHEGAERRRRPGMKLDALSG